VRSLQLLVIDHAPGPFLVLQLRRTILRWYIVLWCMNWPKTEGLLITTALPENTLYYMTTA